MLMPTMISFYRACAEVVSEAMKMRAEAVRRHPGLLGSE